MSYQLLERASVNTSPYRIFDGLTIVDRTKAYTLRNKEHVCEAIRLMNAGIPIACQIGGICGLFTDAANPQAVATVYSIKKETDMSKPLSVVIHGKDFAPLIDTQKIDPQFLQLLSNLENTLIIDPIKLELLTGTLLHIRTPILSSIASNLPPSILSFSKEKIPIMQGLDLSGHPLAKRFMSETSAAGIRFIGVTSLNQNNQPEITTADDAIKYCKEQDIAIFLEDPYFNTNVRGSFTIVDISNPARVIRDGQIPIKIIEQMLLRFDLSKEDMKPAKYPQADYSFLEHLQGFPPELVRQAILLFLINMDPQKIIQVISNKREKQLEKQQSSK